MNDMRNQLMLNYINKKNYASLSELCDYFHISTATARRDLTNLEKDGKISRTFGGAISLNRTYDINDSIDYRLNSNIDKKNRIAEYACNLIRDGESILLDSSTTVECLANFLLLSEKHVTCISNDMRIANILTKSKTIDFIFVGGNITHGECSTTGPMTEQALKQIYVDKSFIGSDCIDAQRGLTMRTSQTVTIKKLEIECSHECYCLVDDSKYMTNGIYNVCGINDIHAVVTNSELPKDVIKKFDKYKDKLVIV